jgi:hypothetical protein
VQRPVNHSAEASATYILFERQLEMMLAATDETPIASR